MAIERIDKSSLEKNPDIINIKAEEIVEIYKIIKNAYNIYLKQYEVSPLKDIPLYDDTGVKRSPDEILSEMDGRIFQLVFLYKYKGYFIHRDLISEFVRKHIPSAAGDQQVRHLGSQGGWNVLNSLAHVPDTDENVPRGFHYLVSIETPNPKKAAIIMKRARRLNANTFLELKKAYDNCCATCGIKEGIADPRNNSIVVKLQQGHMDPRKELNIENTIPQCQYCNQTYKDYFRFNEYGRVIAVNNPEILLQSPRDIQDEMIKVLLEERNKKSE